jgi:hypothetical protein
MKNGQSVDLVTVPANIMDKQVKIVKTLYFIKHQVQERCRQSQFLYRKFLLSCKYIIKILYYNKHLYNYLFVKAHA